MKAIPKYNVVYKGVLRRGGVPFEIEEADADEMREHCAFESTAAPAQTDTKPEAESKPKRTKKKAD